MDPGGRISGGCCGDKEAIEDTGYKVHRVFALVGQRDGSAFANQDAGGG